MTSKVTTSTGSLRRSENLNGVSPGLRRYIGQVEAFAPQGNLPLSQVIRFLLWNAPLMLIFWNLPLAGTIHSVVTLLLGLHYILRNERPTRATFMVAYIAGAEILWRGADSSIISEYCNYAIILLCILVIFKYRLI